MLARAGKNKLNTPVVPQTAEPKRSGKSEMRVKSSQVTNRSNVEVTVKQLTMQEFSRSKREVNEEWKVAHSYKNPTDTNTKKPHKKTRNNDFKNEVVLDAIQESVE